MAKSLAVTTLLSSILFTTGYIEQDVEDTDLVTFSFGMAAGVLLGLIVFKAGGVAIGLGRRAVCLSPGYWLAT